MCAVSMVLGGWTNPDSPNYLQWTPTAPAPDLAKQMLQVIEKLEKLDQRMGLLECKIEERKKSAYKKKLAKRAAARP